MSSHARTLGSWAGIPLGAWRSVGAYSVFVLSCVSSGLVTGWSPLQGVLTTVFKIKKLKWNGVWQELNSNNMGALWRQLLIVCSEEALGFGHPPVFLRRKALGLRNTDTRVILWRCWNFVVRSSSLLYLCRYPACCSAAGYCKWVIYSY
jgi:hypothetical protein